MKNIFSIKFLLVCVFILGCNAKKDINKEMGYTVVESKIDKRKYKDNGRQYYAVTVGLHGDQNIAEKSARGFAQSEFTDKPFKLSAVDNIIGFSNPSIATYT